MTYPLKHPFGVEPQDATEPVTGQEYLDADLPTGHTLKAGCPLCNRTGIRRTQVEEGMPRDMQDMLRDHALTLDTCVECGGSGRLLLTGFEQRELSRSLSITIIAAAVLLGAAAIAAGWAIIAFVLLPAGIAGPFVFRAAEKSRVEQLRIYQRRDKELLGQGMVSWKRQQIIEAELEEQEDEEAKDSPPSLTPEPKQPRAAKLDKTPREKKNKPQSSSRVHPTLIVALVIVGYLLFRDFQTLSDGNFLGSGGEIPWGFLLLVSFFYLRLINR